MSRLSDVRVGNHNDASFFFMAFHTASFFPQVSLVSILLSLHPETASTPRCVSWGMKTGKGVRGASIIGKEVERWRLR